MHDDFEWRDEVAAEKYRQGQARHMIGAIRITSEDGYSIEWCGVTEAYYYKAVSVWLKSPGDESFKRNATCCILSAYFDTWVSKCVCLCRATSRDVPAFIVKKVGECWQ